MAWDIQCTDRSCNEDTRAPNIVDLIHEHRGKAGYFLCGCGKRGYIEKSFELQERGKAWKPFLRGVIPLGDRAHSYQPFVFLVSHEKRGRVDSVWFSSYKDLRRRRVR